MIRTLVLTILFGALCSMNAYGGGHLMCEKMDAHMKTVSIDEDLTSDQKNQLIEELNKADAMCREGKTEEAEEMLKKTNDEWARDYFTRLMNSGN